METGGRIGLHVVLALAALLLLVRAHAVPLMDPDESRFARTSVEMMRSGNIVVPTYEGTPRLVKPPLLHWIQGFLFRVLGPSEFAARLPAVLATLGSLLITAWVARRRFGEEGAMWAAAILATMPIVVAVGRVGTLDALLAVHVIAVVAMDMAKPDEVGPFRPAAIGLLLGMAFLVKGPVGVLLPLLIMLAGRTASGRNVLPTGRATITLAAAWCAVVLPWAVAFMREVGFGAALSTLRTETLERYFSGTSHVEPPWFYAQVILAGLLPWVAPLLMALVRLPGRRRDAAASTALYAAGGLLAGLLFFSLGRSKLASYVLPLAPLAAILVTWELARELDDRERVVGPTLLAGSLGAFGFVLLLAAGRFNQPWTSDVALTGLWIYLAGAALAVVGLLMRRPRMVYGVAALTAFAFLFVAVNRLLPPLAAEHSARDLVLEVPELATERPVVIVDMHLPSLVYYLDRDLERVPAADLPARLGRADDPVLVIDGDDLPAIDPEVRERFRELGRSVKYRVYELAKRKSDEDTAVTVLDGPSGSG